MAVGWIVWSDPDSWIDVIEIPGLAADAVADRFVLVPSVRRIA